MSGKAVAGKTPKESNEDRIAGITGLQTIAKISTVFIVANVLLIILCVLKLEVGSMAFSNNGEKVVYFSFLAINIIHVIAIILLFIGVFSAKEQFIRAFILLNAIWFLVWLLLLLFILISGQAKSVDYFTIGIGIYGILNKALDMVVIWAFLTFKLKNMINIPPAEREFNVLSKTAMTSDNPMALA